MSESDGTSTGGAAAVAAATGARSGVDCGTGAGGETGSDVGATSCGVSTGGGAGSAAPIAGVVTSAVVAGRRACSRGVIGSFRSRLGGGGSTAGVRSIGDGTATAATGATAAARSGAFRVPDQMNAAIVIITAAVAAVPATTAGDRHADRRRVDRRDLLVPVARGDPAAATPRTEVDCGSSRAGSMPARTSASAARSSSRSSYRSAGSSAIARLTTSTSRESMRGDTSRRLGTGPDAICVTTSLVLPVNAGE